MLMPNFWSLVLGILWLIVLFGLISLCGGP